MELSFLPVPSGGGFKPGGEHGCLVDGQHSLDIWQETIR